MNEAVSRLSVGQRQAQMEAPAPEPEDPYDHLDEDEKILLGVAEEEMVEIIIDGKKAQVAKSQLAPPAPPAPVYQAPAPVAPAYDHTKAEELDRTIADLRGQIRTPTPPNDALAEEDPDAFNRQVAVYNRDLIAAQKAQQSLEQANHQRQQLANQQQAVALAAEQQRLAAAWPEWSNPNTKPKIAQKLQEYAQSIGYTPQEAAVISNGQVDHRMVLSLRDGMRAEIRAKPRTRRGPGKTPKVGNPGVQQSETRKRTRRREDFVQRAERDGINIDQAAQFLAGKHSQ
jgi:exonuclease VII large subunit